jgi:hypothetical protein
MNQPKQFLANIGNTFAVLFSFPERQKSVWLYRLWLAFLFLSGIAAWGYFFSWGNFSVNFHDWASITAPRFEFLKNAASTWQLPLTISDMSTLNYITDRYLAVPDSFISPQFILLRWMNVQVFCLVNLLIFYTVGFWGLLKIKKRFQLSPVAFTLLFYLFNFNGHIVAHTSAGHATWSGYFLFPFFALLIFDLLKGDRTWSWVTKISVLLFIMFINGSFHQFVWCILFLCLTAVLIPATFWQNFRGALFACLASLVKILPPVLMYGQFDNRFISGYPTLWSLWDALVTVHVPADLTVNEGMTSAIGMWELTLFVGLGGALFLIGFGLVHWLRSKDSPIDHRLVLPLAAMTFLTIGLVYSYFRKLHLPLFDGERVSTRMISLVFVFVLILATVQFQQWLNRKTQPGWLYGLIGLGTVLTVHDLWQNFRIWSINQAAALYTEKIFDPQQWFVNNNYNDRGYLLFIAAGALASIGTFALLAYLSRRERKTSQLITASSLE